MDHQTICVQLATSFFVALHPHNDRWVLSFAVCISNLDTATSVWVQSTIICIHNVDSSLVIFTTYGAFFSLANDNRPYFLWIKEEKKIKQHYQYVKDFGTMFTCRAPYNFASLVPASVQPITYTLPILRFLSDAAKFTSIGSIFIRWIVRSSGIVTLSIYITVVCSVHTLIEI